MNRGGAETMIMNIYRNINYMSFNFDFITFTDKESDYDKEILKLGGRIFYVKPFSLLNPLRFIEDLRQVIQKNGPFHAVHAHTLFNIGLIALAARKEKIKLRIAHAHSTRDTLNDNIVRKMYQRIMKHLIIRNANSLIACGKEAGVFLFGKEFERKGMIVPNAVDLDKYLTVSSDDITNLKKKLEIGENIFIIGQVGTLNEIKNYHYSISIAQRLKNIGFEFCMIFVGDGDLRKNLELEVEEKGLSSYVRFVGLRNDVPLFLNIFDLFIMPSLYEGLPLALIEAQATGIPCIVSSKVTSEADIGLGLVEFVNIDQNHEEWVERILAKKTDGCIIDVKDIKSKFRINKYDIKSNSDLYLDLYKLRRIEIERLL
ncbi:glycosyltransferase family 1 protein [Paenibacillus sp. LHD-38]|uniref:glycosyltransferase family 1 protein n=1 Tax=Paenibacillus sp. LHD-38 TaxID=3072143 RepID=UPI00280CD3FB|nr:glycosyltransferase family 1 protein [Paenibacillus sp. LHD-38]MDQ8738351.1 glycosyltransferase family 1 protein [Paenibacillus sp. LHD-38]